MSCAAAFTATMPAARAVGRPAARAAAATLQPAAAFRGTMRAAVSRRQFSRQRGSGIIVWANWGAPVEFAAGKVLSNEKEAEQLQRLTVQIGGAASAYTKAGQFIQAKFGEEGKAGFFAIASAPNSGDKENGSVELLVKNQGGTAEQLCTAEAGSAVLVSAPMGKGFPVDSIPPAQFPTVLIFATGSGISPIKALIESGALQAGERKAVRLYYGVRSPAHLAFAAALPEWSSQHGVEVVTVFSEEGQGYVQDAAAKDGAIDWSAGVAAVLCGQKDMAIAVTELLTSKGVAKEHVLTNF